MKTTHTLSPRGLRRICKIMVAWDSRISDDYARGARSILQELERFASIMEKSGTAEA